MNIKSAKHLASALVILTGLCIAFHQQAVAQTTHTAEGKNGKKPVTYILPDGRTIGPDKLDSLKKVWGADRVIMKHNEADDAGRIIHLEQLTDQMMSDMAANVDAQGKWLEAMLGKAAADFTATDMQGNMVTLSALKGKVVVLNFWFTSCPPCIAEMTDLNKLSVKYVGQNVVFLGLSFNDSTAVGKFLSSHQFKYQLLVKAKGAIEAYKIHSYPTHLVIDKNGNLIDFHTSSDQIFELLSAAIDKSL